MIPYWWIYPLVIGVGITYIVASVMTDVTGCGEERPTRRQKIIVTALFMVATGWAIVPITMGSWAYWSDPSIDTPLKRDFGVQP